MKATGRAALAGLLLAACAAPSRPPATAPAASDPGDASRLLVLTGRLVDGTGAPAVEDGIVVVEGDRIRCAGTRAECPAPAGARVIDAEGGTILPGLVDLHVHARPHYLSLFLPAGVTSVRDLNNDFEMIDTLRAAGPRPRIFASGPLLDGEGSVIARMGGRVLPAATPEEARASVDTLVARGASVVKLYEKIPPAAFAAAAGRAREVGIPTATDLGIQLTRGLTDAEVDALQALEAGVSSIEHSSGFALAYRRLGGDPARLPLDPALVDSLARALVRSGATLVPTLVTAWSFASDSLPDVRDLPSAALLPEGMTEWWAGMHGGTTPEQRARARADLELSRALVRRVVEMGGRVGAGSDVPAGPMVVPGGSLHRELELLVEAGLTPLQAIRAATGEAGALLGRPELGTLTAGSLADVLVVGGDPARDVRATRDVRWVVLGGEVVAPAATVPAP